MYHIGIDLGGTKIAGGLITSEGDLLVKKSIPTLRNRDVKEILKDIIDLALELIDKRADIASIGVGVPGPVEPNTGEVIKCINLGWAKIPLKEILENALQIKVSVGNDATLAGLAELKVGAMKNAKSGVMLTLGTGIGGAVVLDGKIISGYNGIASEFGHMKVGEGFYNCNCGKNGCLETFSSGTALIKYTRKLIEDEIITDSILMKESDNNLDKLNAYLIFEAAKKGDKAALKAVDRMAEYLGIGIINIVSVIDPEIIVIGGGVSQAGDFLLNRIKKAALSHRFYKEIPIGDIVPAQLGNDAGIIGAGLYSFFEAV